MSAYNTYLKGELKPVPRSARAIIVQAQTARSHILYEEYFQREDTRSTVEFFFEKIYSLDGKEERDHLTRRTVDKVRRFIKVSTREKLDKLMLLNDITDYLDTKMCQLMIAKGWQSDQQISNEQFEALYQQLDNRAERIEQLELLLWNFATFFEISKRPIIKVLYKPLKAAARMFNAKPLFQMFDEAYQASGSITDELFGQFLKSVEQTERNYIERLLPKTT